MVAGAALGTAAAKATERDVLAERTAALEQREAEVAQRDTNTVQREDALSLRSDGLDTRQTELDKISADLGRREQALLPKEQAAARSKITKDGIYLVGKDIEPGTYQTSGGSGCYWQRSSGTSGDFDDILANGNESGQAIVTIAASDVAFTTKRCGSWHWQRMSWPGSECRTPMSFCSARCEHEPSGREDPSTLELQE
ncbi:hypothetical protein [Rhodococcus opacus]|uniref:hypothetical protein n=1 Tax=Rhodococcus opacus TaxID=37919 RepID=UPI001F5A429F|nr:hypothetical protein [Rhodococcus opacus]UNN05184.1 hypothetical protein MOO23_40445 [Rhodococcus opacus]